MGGAVIGYARDNTSIFYNPGSLSFVDSNSITITANMYQMERYRIKDANANQKDLSSSQIGSVPLMVGGMLGQGKNRLKIGYGVISPVNFTFSTTSRVSGLFPVVNEAESPGEEEFVGQSNINSRLNEVTGIIGIGFKINEHWGVGYSNMLTGRNQDFNRNTIARYFLNDGNNSLSTFSYGRSASYFHVRYTGKLGVCYRRKRFTAGLAITPPTIGIMGSGIVTADVVGTNVLYEGSRTNILLNDRQEELKVIYKTPFNIAIGSNWNHRRWTFGVSLEFYGRQKTYTVMNAQASGLVLPASFYPNLGGSNFLRQKDGAKSVLNFGLASELIVLRNLNLVCSFRTNRSFYDHGLDQWEGIKTEVTTWNIYHIRAGAIIKQGHSQLCFGFLYAFGSDANRPQTGEYSVPDETQFLKPQTANSKASYSSLGFVLGYSFLLFDL